MPYRHGHVTDHDPPEQGLKLRDLAGHDIKAFGHRPRSTRTRIETLAAVRRDRRAVESPTTIHQNKD